MQSAERLWTLLHDIQSNHGRVSSARIAPIHTRWMGRSAPAAQEYLSGVSRGALRVVIIVLITGD
jgi:hypothetical protein